MYVGEQRELAEMKQLVLNPKLANLDSSMGTKSRRSPYFKV